MYHQVIIFCRFIIIYMRKSVTLLVIFQLIYVMLITDQILNGRRILMKKVIYGKQDMTYYMLVWHWNQAARYTLNNYFIIRDGPFNHKGEGSGLCFLHWGWNCFCTKNQITVVSFIFVTVIFRGLVETEMLFDIWIWFWYLQMTSPVIHAFRCAQNFVGWLNQRKPWKLVFNE